MPGMVDVPVTLFPKGKNKERRSNAVRGATNKMTCRICGSGNAKEIGEVEYYLSFAWPIYDCTACGCRFTRHDNSIYEWLHRQSGSSYALYRELLEKCKRFFDAGDIDRLRTELCANSKYRWIIEAIEQRGKSDAILEVGCSRGYLTSYFILAGYNVLGADVSAEAINAARAAFGDFFETSNSALTQQRAPYDAIYHVGMIGCVADPVGMTHQLFDLLKPGGQLLFNAPNVEACSLKAQLWIDASPPPDVVTLFRPGFWSDQFSSHAKGLEEIEMSSPEHSFVIGLRKLAGCHWHKPTPIPLEQSADDFKMSRVRNHHVSNRMWNIFERGMVGIARGTGVAKLVPPQPTPFGLFVTMTKK
jgi:SAM-dependent methyltransferase